jgi:transcriptional regulator with XRE-family HTH domain
MPDIPSDSQKIYWAEFILQLRHELGWSQSRLAEELRTDQTTVSRWERGLMLPRVSVRSELETLANKGGLLTLSQVAGFVKASPFPMILVDRTAQTRSRNPACAVFPPQPGIVCDKKAQFCADAEGISMGYTKEYLGAKAEVTMMNRIKEAGGPSNYGLTWFGFSNGVDCKVKDKVCRVSRNSNKVDAATTKALFGG